MEKDGIMRGVEENKTKERCDSTTRMQYKKENKNIKSFQIETATGISNFSQFQLHGVESPKQLISKTPKD